MEPRTRVLSNWGPMIGLCAKSMLSATTLVVFGIKIKIEEIFFVPSLQLENAIVWCICRKVSSDRFAILEKTLSYGQIIHPFWQVVLFVSPISWLKLTNQTIRRFNQFAISIVQCKMEDGHFDELVIVRKVIAKRIVKLHVVRLDGDLRSF